MALPLREFDPKKEKLQARDQATKALIDDLKAYGFEDPPLYVQRPLVKSPNVAQLVRLLEATAKRAIDGEKVALPPTLQRCTDPDLLDLPTGAEFVIEGELMAQGLESKTEIWLDIRIPLPDPAAGGFDSAEAWEKWVACCRGQLTEGQKARDDLAGRIGRAYRLRHRGIERPSSQKIERKVTEFRAKHLARFDEVHDGRFWFVAARTWHDSKANEHEWRELVNAAIQAAAQEAFMALGGFDDPATVLAAARSGLLDFVEQRAAA